MSEIEEQNTIKKVSIKPAYPGCKNIIPNYIEEIKKGESINFIAEYSEMPPKYFLFESLEPPLKKIIHIEECEEYLNLDFLQIMYAKKSIEQIKGLYNQISPEFWCHLTDEIIKISKKIQNIK